MSILLWIIVIVAVLWLLGFLGGGGYSGPYTGYRVVYGSSGGNFFPGLVVLVVVILILVFLHVL